MRRRSEILQLLRKARGMLAYSGVRAVLARAWRYAASGRLREALDGRDDEVRLRRWLRRNRRRRGTASAILSTLDRPPKVGVVVVARSGAEDAVRSLHRQTYQNWEIAAPDPVPARADASLVDRLHRASEEYVLLVFDDVTLVEHALARMVGEMIAQGADLAYSDTCRVTGVGTWQRPWFKPDFSPELLMSCDYFESPVMCSSPLIRQAADAVRSGPATPYHLSLAASERARRIVHVPEILGLERASSVAASGDETQALRATLVRRGTPGDVLELGDGLHHVRYAVQHAPRVSIVIATRNRGDMLRTCVQSIVDVTDYSNFELVLVDHASDDPEAVEVLQRLAARENVQVVGYRGPFNWSAMNNAGAREATGAYLLFLNNDVVALHPEWLRDMLGYAQLPHVGAVGAKLLFPDGTVQHAGVMINRDGSVVHLLHGAADSRARHLTATKDVSAVTGACLLTARTAFASVGGFREDLRVAYNDVDYCLRVGLEGKFVVWTPGALLTHFESASRGTEQPEEDIETFRRLWAERIRGGDPFYSAHLDRRGRYLVRT